jgi:hypothetical protein
LLAQLTIAAIGRTCFSTANVSDEGESTWRRGLMIDEREKVTYPDGVQAEDGTIYIIYDHNRTPDGAVMMAVFTEEDARAGRAATDNVRRKVEVARLSQEQE